MKKLSLLLLLFVFVFVGCSDDDEATFVANFDGKLTESNSEFISTSTTLKNFYFFDTFQDNNKYLTFDHYYNDWGSGYSFAGITYTNKTDITTSGNGNPSAITGKGKNGQIYLTAYSSSYNPAKVTLNNNEKYIYKGVWVTNSTNAYLAITEGKNSMDIDTKFENDDWFKLTATGYDLQDKNIGNVEIYLADYRNGKKTVLKDWTWFDLSPISFANYIIFELSSSDSGKDGMNTPAYFCMDGITIEEK